MQITSCLSQLQVRFREVQHQDEKIIDAFINAVVFHPNVGGALILTHDRQYMETLKASLPESESIKFLSFMSCNGREQAVEAGRLAGLELSRQITQKGGNPFPFLSFVSH